MFTEDERKKTEGRTRLLKHILHLVFLSSSSETIIFVEGWDGGRQGHSHDCHPTPHHHGRQPYGQGELLAVFRIRIHIFLGLPDPDPLVRGMDQGAESFYHQEKIVRKTLIPTVL
jgi:hypothetical protein